MNRAELMWGGVFLASLISCAAQPTTVSPVEPKKQTIPAEATIQILDFKCQNGAITELHLDASGETTKRISWDNAKQCGPGT